MVERFDGSPEMQPYKNGEWVRHSDYAELEAEMERMRKKNEYLEDRNEECEHWRIHWKTKAFEALSRTGAVMEGMKQAATIILAQIDSKPDWTPEQEDELRKHDPVDTARAAARVAIKQCHRAILSALEPAAPEGRQEDDRIRREMDEILRKQSDRDIPFAPSTRPSEQAVTEAMERFERIADIIERNLWRQDEKVEDAKQIAIQGAVALKAAMEAGR